MFKELLLSLAKIQTGENSTSGKWEWTQIPTSKKETVCN